MENPASWNSATKIIQNVLSEFFHEQTLPAEHRPIGFSLAKRINDALEQQGLLNSQ